MQIAKLLGATVVAAASTRAKRQTALALGADHAVDYTRAGWPGTVRELTGGAGVDVALEMSGGRRLAETLEALAPFGRAVVYGMASGTPGHLPAGTVVPLLYDPSPNQSVHAFNLGLWFGLRPRAAAGALEQLIGWVARGAVRISVARVLALDEAAEAHRLLETGATSGKLVLAP